MVKGKAAFNLIPGKCGCNIMLDLSPKRIAEKEKKHDFLFWQLRTPLTRYALSDRTYGLDNGCFSGKLPSGWYKLLEDARSDLPLWATIPDVVGSARRTLELWPKFKNCMNGIPRALVLQDGIGEVSIPWDELACIFIGGTDAFKISNEAFACAKAARILGKWIHVGRVNTVDRLAQWIDFADSIDGAGISKDLRGNQLQPIVEFIKYGHKSKQQEMPW